MIRTIQVYAVYCPRTRKVLTFKKLKREAKERQVRGTVIVKLRGTYATGAVLLR